MNKPEGHKFPQKLKADWKLVGNGKPTETVKSNMKGKWTSRWFVKNKKSQAIKEYEEIERGDQFNISSASKGDLDFLKERHLSYREHYKYLQEGARRDIIQLKPTDILSVENGQVYVNGRPFELTDPDESLDWPKKVENNQLITRFHGRASQQSSWRPEEISGYYTPGLSEGDVNALNHPAKINYTDDDHYDNCGDSNRSVPNLTPPLNMDTVIDSIPHLNLEDYNQVVSGIPANTPTVNQPIDIDVPDPIDNGCDESLKSKPQVK
jgi:hypothetical protein